MKKVKLKLIGTSYLNPKSKKPLILEFTVYEPRTDTSYAKAYITKSFRAKGNRQLPGT